MLCLECLLDIRQRICNTPQWGLFVSSISVYRIFSTHKGTKSNILKINLLLLRSFIPRKAKTFIHGFPGKTQKNGNSEPLGNREFEPFKESETCRKMTTLLSKCNRMTSKWKNRRSRMVLSGQESGRRRRKCVIIPTSSPDTLLTNPLINLK